MVPTLSVYVAADMLYGVVLCPGAKGLRVDAVAAVPYDGEPPLEEFRRQLGEGASWSALALVLESTRAAIARFPVEPDQSDSVVREQVELEIVQQFLSTPSEGYTADVYRLGPDVERRYSACAVCLLADHRAFVQRVQDTFGMVPSVTVAPVAMAAAFAYNYPERHSTRCALGLISADTVELVTIENEVLVYWESAPLGASVEVTLQQVVRQALVACGNISALYLAGTGLTRQRFEQLAIHFEGRFAEPVGVLDAFRMLQCGMRPELCKAAAPLGHVFAPAVGAALQPFYARPAWRIDALDTAVPA